MRGRALIVIALALVLGAASIFLVRAWTESRIRAAGANSNVAMTTMVVARTPLGFGARVRPSVLEEVAWPANAVVPDSFRTIKELTGGGNGQEGEERVVLRQIEKGEPILKSKVSGFGQRPSLSAKISKGMRAATIRVNDVLGVGGFVLPGDRVDIMLTRNLNDDTGTGGGGKLITDLLLQNVKVLGIDQIASEDKEQARVARSVTLEVTPQQAQKLTLALRVGTLSLTLRNYGAAENAGTRRVTVSDLNVFEVNKPKAPAPKVVRKKTKRVAKKGAARDQYSTVKILRGLKEDSEKVPTEAADPLYPGQSIVAPSAPTNLLPNSAGSGAPAAKPANPAAMKEEPKEEPKKAPAETESATPSFKKAPIGLPLGPAHQTASPADKDA